MHKIRVILDAEEDIIRTLLVDSDNDLEKLHFSIAKAFGFNGQEMASFYRTDDEWNQGEEIPLFNMAEAGEAISMSSCITKEIFSTIGTKLIYVYDFLDMWTFYVESIETGETVDSDQLPKTILSIGELPEKAPEKEFVADSLDEDFDEDFNDEFESLDDIDFDNY